MRTQLLSAITQAVSTLTQFAVSQELPWEQNGTALYRKNMKKIYVDRERVEQTTLIPTLNGNEVFQNDLIAEVYLDGAQVSGQRKAGYNYHNRIERNQ
jgi:hypothetical protein